MSVREGVPPTKTNLIALKEELLFAKQGFDLLDQKKNILVNELLNLVDHGVECEKRANETLALAYKGLQLASCDGGQLNLLSLVGAIHIKTSIEVKKRKVMGVSLPLVKTDFKDMTPYVSPQNISPYLPDLMEAFKGALKILGELAELKISIIRLANELKKTIRKVNALDKIAIPELQDTVHFINNRLEENERESFILLKMTKKKLQGEKYDISS